MKMVIDISENWETQIMNMSDSEVIDFLYAIICSGTPLPKGHGRLLDVDVVKEGIGDLDGFSMLERCIDEMPTVIEADGGAE